MRIIRIATITFPNKIDALFGRIKIETDNILIETKTVNHPGKEKMILIEASTNFPKPYKRNKNDLVVIPFKEVRELESYIEYMGNYLSVISGMKRIISSPTPFLALKYESQDDVDWLNTVKGFNFIVKTPAHLNSRIQIPLIESFQHLIDRSDGVAILAEAYSNQNLSGRFHEFFRLFERAFKCSSKSLISPLTDFLVLPKMKYSTKEIEKWIFLRHGITHADIKNDFLMEADVRPYIARVEQACLDVLFNKKIWRNKSTERKENLSIDFGNRIENQVFIKKGSSGIIQFAMLDSLGSFPLHLSAGTKTLPENWWSPHPAQSWGFKMPLGVVFE